MGFAQKSSAIACGGVPLLHRLCERLGLKRHIDDHVHVLKQHQPYHASDHALNIAFNILAGGTRIEHIEPLRRNAAYLDALGTHSLPDPTTAGDFCRRFETAEKIDLLQEAINETRLAARQGQDASFFERAVIDGDGTLCAAEGQCKEGMDIAYAGTWGYHPLVISLANTAEPLYLFNRSGNRPSHDDASGYFDKIKTLCRRAGFRQILHHFRGDTDFTQTKHLDRWDDEGVTFTFGIDARRNLIDIADALEPACWAGLTLREPRAIMTEERAKLANVKNEVIDRRGFRHMRMEQEDVPEVAYGPTIGRKAFRLVIVKKTIHVTQGLYENLPWETRYFFCLSNRRDMTASEIVQDARQRCDQENLNAHLKNGVHALTMPLGSLHANWAGDGGAGVEREGVGGAGFADGRAVERASEESRKLLRMEFHTFRQA